MGIPSAEMKLTARCAKYQASAGRRPLRACGLLALGSASAGRSSSHSVCPPSAPAPVIESSATLPTPAKSRALAACVGLSTMPSTSWLGGPTPLRRSTSCFVESPPLRMPPFVSNSTETRMHSERTMIALAPRGEESWSLGASTGPRCRWRSRPAAARAQAADERVAGPGAEVRSPPPTVPSRLIPDLPRTTPSGLGGCEKGLWWEEWARDRLGLIRVGGEALL